MSIPYFRPVAAYGPKASEKTLSGSTAIGGTTVSFDNSGGAYDAGDHVFAANATGAYPQYLGQVVSAGSSSIVVEVGSRYSMVAGWTIWQPAAVWRWTYGPGDALAWSWEPSVEARTTRSGLVFATQFGDGLRALAMDWRFMLPTDWQGFLAFLAGRSNGAEAFSLGYWSALLGGFGSLARVVLDPSDIALALALRGHYGSGRFRFFLEVENEAVGCWVNA